jgi:hypothetical protein
MYKSLKKNLMGGGGVKPTLEIKERHTPLTLLLNTIIPCRQ